MFIFLYRLSRKYRAFNFLLRVLFSCDIARDAKISKSVVFNHKGLGVVIHPATVIDENCHIEHHVCCGQRLGDVIEAPHISKDCVIGAYAILLGGIKIGEGSVIGAGSIITHDVPPHTIVYNNRNTCYKDNYKMLHKY